MAGFHDVGDDHEQFARVMVLDLAAHAPLNLGSKVVRVQSIDAAIHKAKAVGGTDYGVSREVRDRAAMNSHEREITTETFPRVGER